MNLIFQRGTRELPVGHALIYFQGNDGSTLATYVSVPPIPFDLSKFVPGFLAGAMEGMDLGNAMVATPIPPIPEPVTSPEYLRALAERRQDDLVFAGGTMAGDPMRLAAETAEAARLYGELYGSSAQVPAAVPPTAPAAAEGMEYAGLSDLERIAELSSLTGLMRDSVASGAPDEAIERRMRALAAALPAKYRAGELIHAAALPGPTGQRLAELYLERAYKLHREEYLDLERIDREIEAMRPPG